MTVFEHFHFLMCVSPQLRAIFRHQNFKKCSQTLSFLTFWLPNVCFATAARNLSTWKLQKVLPDPQFFNILTSACASRHSGVQFCDIRTSKSGPKMTCFVHFHFQIIYLKPNDRPLEIGRLTGTILWVKSSKIWVIWVLGIWYICLRILRIQVCPKKGITLTILFRVCLL